jgi:hypothetical protein
MSKPLRPGDVLKVIRTFNTHHKRLPTSRDVDGSIRAAAMRHFGSWDQAVKNSLNGDTTDAREAILKDIRDLRDKLGRIPDSDDLRDYKSTLPLNVSRFYDHICNALEKALGKSPCQVILAIIDELTPVGVDGATSPEILAELEKKGMKFHGAQLAVHLKHLYDMGQCTFGAVDRNGIWRLTPTGRSHVASLRVK